MASTLSAALFYSTEKEWPVLPVWPMRNGKCACGLACGTPGKHPIAKHGAMPVAPHGVKSATTDLDTIRRWWRLVPDANIGVRGDTFFALDVDRTEALEELEDGHGKLPDTVESLSGSGGRHILFNQPDGYKIGNEEGDLPPGINVRGTNGYIIVAPSIHQSGNRYRWELSSHPRDIDPADAPEWLLELIGRKEEIEIVNYTTGTAPNIDRLAISKQIKEAIKSVPPRDNDRSSGDMKVIVALLKVGCTPEQVKAVFGAYPIGNQGKYAERGDEYLDRSIANAIMYVGRENVRMEQSRITGEPVTPQVAQLEKAALDAAYLRGWADALAENPELVEKMWPGHVGISSSSITLYGLGLRKDVTITPGDERQFPALVVPYHTNGTVSNVEYEIYGAPDNTPNSIWHSPDGVMVFDTNIDGSLLSSQVLLTEDWDTAAHSYLNYGHMFQWLEFLGVPNLLTGSEAGQLARMRALASMLEHADRILIAWPSSRMAEARQLASLLEAGSERVRHVNMPFPMRDMYSKYQMSHQQLNRFVRQASPIS